MERDIILEMSKLLEKTGLEDIVPAWPADSAKALETALANLKNCNARYEKGEAITQVKWLMDAYNIQIDELIERISS